MAYGKKVLDHYENPRNVGVLDKDAINVGTGKLGGLFGTFLAIPPQYSVNGDGANATLSIEIQKTMLPLLYGVMHCVLLSLSLLPLGMCRGFARGLSMTFPWLSQKWYGLPVDEIEHLHRTWGWMSIGGLVVGCFIWMIMMGESCFNDPESTTSTLVKACQAFNPNISSSTVGGTNQTLGVSVLFGCF